MGNHLAMWTLMVVVPGGRGLASWSGSLDYTVLRNEKEDCVDMHGKQEICSLASKLLEDVISH